MTRQLVFASGNQHKLKEVAQVLEPFNISVISMRDLGFDGEIEEPGATLEENAAIKARFIHERYGLSCFSDDSGLEIAALKGAPGVHSARFAGEGCSFEDNVQKVLKLMTGEQDRTAAFRTVICLIWEGKEYFFEGRVSGEITDAQQGEQGFGYDPIFRPAGHTLTFAEMTAAEKNAMSHRALAVKDLVRFFESL